jgi:hypothetical protein
VTQDRLFAGDSLHDRLQAELAAAIRAVEARGPDWLLERSVDEAAAEALAAYQVPPLEIAWERRWSPGVRETTVDMQHNIMYGGAGQGRPVHVPADQVFVHVPFTGERDLLFCRPSTFSLSSPRAKVTADELILEITQTNLSGEQIAAAFDSFRSQVESSAATANADVAAHNEQLAAVLRGRVETRRRRLLAQRELTASLPFDIRPTGVQPTFAVPAKRKRVHLTQPRPSKPFEPQPELMNATYEDILERIVAAAQQLERAPETFEGMGEEDLRNLLLVSLNMAYEGQAGAELFSRAGKTDIAVTVGDRKVFIAECEVWGGQRKFSAAVDQLLGYLVWRDSKAALVLFIKGGQPTDVISKADAAITAHPQCAQRSSPKEPGRRVDYQLRSTADEQRLIHTALLPVVIVGRRPAKAEDPS